MNPRLALGLALILLAWWCGPQGYGDLLEYAQVSDNLWRHGTFAYPDGHESRFCWGFPALLLPLRALGALLETLAGRDDLAHWATSLLPPAATVLAACLIERFARRAGATPADAVRAALITALAASTLYYSRMLNLEPLVGALLIAAVVLAEEAAGMGRACAAGTCLGAAFACHYANGAAIGILAIGLAWRLRLRLGFAPALALGGAALVWVGLTAWTNEARYGALLTSGYNRSEKVALEAHDLVAGIPRFGEVLLAVPWFAPLLGWGVWRALAAGRRHADEARPAPVTLLLLAVGVQTLLWLCTWQFSYFSLRYLVPTIMLAGLMLPSAMAGLRARPGCWPGFAISRGSAVVLLWGMLAFLKWGDFCRPVTVDSDHPVFPGRPLAAMWYQPRDPYVEIAPYEWNLPGQPEMAIPYPERPLVWWTALLGAGLLAGGALLLGLAARRGAVAGAGSP